MDNILFIKTKEFASKIIKFVQGMQYNMMNSVFGKQLLRCGTSVYINYRAVCRARSKADFIAKLGIVEEETDESIGWLELIVENNIAKASETEELIKSAKEILAMVVASLKTAKQDRNKR